MSGICGFINFEKTIKQPDIIHNMLKKISHRGKIFNSITEDKFSIGIRRLNINSKNVSNTIFYDNINEIYVLLDGEIYNYNLLKLDLLDDDYTFNTTLQEELIATLYVNKKMNFLNMLRGMFSLLIYDKKENKIFVARDFFGIKPLYYSFDDNQFVFSSEIKSILEYPNIKKEVNEDALAGFLSFQYSVLPETFFKGIFKVPPGGYLEITKDNISSKKYADLKFKPKSSKLQDAIEKLDRALKESVTIHTKGQTKVGSFLSSGVDSSYICSTFNGKKSFTVGFDYENYNEIDFAKNLCENINIDNFNKIISTDEFWEQFPKIQYYMDEPLADPSALSTYFVSKIAKEHVDIALSGEGADEILAGYNIYKEPFDISIMGLVPFTIRKLIGKFVEKLPFKFKGKNFLIRCSKPIEERFIGNAKIFDVKEKYSILKNPKNYVNPFEITKPYYDEVKGLDDVSKMQYIDMNLWLVGDILLKVDKMSMANSLKVRLPFLDKEVFEVVSSIQDDYRVNKQATKYVFRMVSKEYIPDEISSKKNLGIPTPIRIWIKEDKYYNKIKNEFLSETSEKYFNTDVLIKYLDNHLCEKYDNSRKIWTIYSFLIWHKQFFEK